MNSERKNETGKIKRKIQIKEDFWVTTYNRDEEPELIASRCHFCEEIYFPRRKKGICIHCEQRGLEDIRLRGKGKIASFTVVEQAPAGGFYKGPVPYAYGKVHLLEGVALRTLFTGNLDELEVGMDVEMVIEKLYDDEEGNEIITYKFTSANKGGGPNR